MVEYRDWVFECPTAGDEFARHLARHLRDAGYHVAPARVHDLAVAGPGGRAYVRLGYHDAGIAVAAKLKPALLLGSAAQLESALLEAGRAAQARIYFGVKLPAQQRNP